uniref:IFT25 protein n=1 Tax=Chelonoidis abingdonii TaxID=106734 RepID=A0A8C0GZ73_CHEAB
LNKEHSTFQLTKTNGSETFWTTTGMFPQEFIISFHKCVKISKLTIQCYLVLSLRIEKSLSKDPVDFEVLVHTHSTPWTAQPKAVIILKSF